MIYDCSINYFDIFTLHFNYKSNDFYCLKITVIFMGKALTFSQNYRSLMTLRKDLRRLPNLKTYYFLKNKDFSQITKLILLSN